MTWCVGVAHEITRRPVASESKRPHLDFTYAGQSAGLPPCRYTLWLKISATWIETSEIGFGDLHIGDDVDVYGSDDAVESACILADTIQKYVTAP